MTKKKKSSSYEMLATVRLELKRKYRMFLNE